MCKNFKAGRIRLCHGNPPAGPAFPDDPALESAGLMTGFSSLYWTYANGFPKARNIGKAVDTRLGAERQVLFEKPMPNMKGGNFGQGKRSYEKTSVSYTLPATEEAKKLDGSYGGFQPKPAVEVILVVMKPLDQKSYTEQAMINGKGITWLDDCRIPYASDEGRIKEKDIKDRFPRQPAGERRHSAKRQ